MFAPRTPGLASLAESETVTVVDSPGASVPPVEESDSQGRSVSRSSSTSTSTTSSAIWSAAHSAPVESVSRPPPWPAFWPGNHHALTSEQSSGSICSRRVGRFVVRSVYQMVSDAWL